LGGFLDFGIFGFLDFVKVLRMKINARVG
jgi:hypothetical protein